MQAGATAVVPETLEPSLQLASAVLSQLNMPQDEVAHAIQAFRRSHISELQVCMPIKCIAALCHSATSGFPQTSSNESAELCSWLWAMNMATSEVMSQARPSYVLLTCFMLHCRCFVKTVGLL